MDLIWRSPQARQRWYVISGEATLGEDLTALFQPMEFDAETEAFLERSLEQSNNICLQFWYSLAATLLSLMLSKTSINGMLGRGGMFLLSRAQVQRFLDYPSDVKRGAMLDLGAGDGGITATAFAPFFERVFVTDASTFMQWRLAQRGFEVIPVDNWMRISFAGSRSNPGPYRLISALNLLDRHYDPWQLLEDIWQLARASTTALRTDNLEKGEKGREECLVLISLVLPLSPYVEFNLEKDGRKKSPTKTLPFRPLPPLTDSSTADSFESHVKGLVERVFRPAGFKLLRWTKLPYLCDGDLRRPFYHLPDALFLLRAVEEKVPKFQEELSQVVIDAVDNNWENPSNSRMLEL